MLLIVDDIAGNHELARRFLIFDNENTVSISERETEKLWVSSAAENTSYGWITTLDENVSLLCFNFNHEF